MSHGVIEGYAKAAPDLVTQFGAIDAQAHLAPVRAFLPDSPARVIDVGAGTGTEAVWLASLGHSVVAVEPVVQFHQTGVIEWREDRLPDLQLVMAGAQRYDLVLALGVIQHLEPQEQYKSIETLNRLTAPGGRLILSLRHGPGHPDRQVFDIDVDAILDCAACAGLTLCSRQAAGSLQEANRPAGVVWTWLVLDR